MGLVQDLYKTEKMPPGNVPKQQKRDALEFFSRRLAHELSKPYVWLAHATVAVDAGAWKGNRLVARRQKLLRIIHELQKSMGLPMVEMAPGWERVNLYYGYNAADKYAAATGLNLNSILFIGYMCGQNGDRYRAEMKTLADEAARRVSTVASEPV